MILGQNFRGGGRLGHENGPEMKIFKGTIWFYPINWGRERAPISSTFVFGPPE